MSKQDFTSEEFAHRRQRLRSRIAAAGLDWMVLFHPSSIHWVTGSDAKSYQAFQCLLVGADELPLVMIVRESDRAEIEADTLVDKAVGWGGPEPGDPLLVFAAVARDLGLLSARVGIEVPSYYLHPHHYVRLKSFLGDALQAEPSNLVPELKMVKSAQELAYVRDAARTADDAMAVFAQSLRVGRTEIEIAGDVHGALLCPLGGLAASTMNLVSGERSAFSHGAPTERRLRLGDYGSIEYGAVRRRYTATIGRQFSIGAPTPRMRDLYEIVRTASDAMRAEIREGVGAVVPHEAAKKIIAEAGLDRYRVHTSGYGIAPGFPPAWGEPVNMFGGSEDILRAGMVLSIEPPVFIPEEALGARLVDNVVVTEMGCEPLTSYPLDLIVIER